MIQRTLGSRCEDCTTHLKLSLAAVQPRPGSTDGLYLCASLVAQTQLFQGQLRAMAQSLLRNA